MFLTGEPARIRQDAVTPPRNTRSYPPITSPETPPNPPSLSSMAAMSASEIQYRFRDSPSPPPNRPLPPLPPSKVRPASPSMPPFPGAQVTKERLSAKRPKRSPTPPRRHTTPTPKTKSTFIDSIEEEVEPEPAFTPDKDIEEFVSAIAKNQLDSPTRPSCPRQRLSSNSLKRISAPAVPYDPVTEKTPVEIAKRNRRTNIFQVFDQLGGEKAGLDDIHEEHSEGGGGEKEAAKKKDRRESRHSGAVWNGAPVSPLSQRSSMKSVQDLVWPEERQGNGSPVSRSSQRNSMKSVQNMVWPEDKERNVSPSSRLRQRNSTKSVQGLIRPEDKQENRSPTSTTSPLSQRSSMKYVQDLVWPEEKKGSRSPSSRSSRRSSTKSVQDLVWPGESKRDSEKFEGLVRRSTGQVIDRDPMASQEGSIFTGSQNSPPNVRTSVKTIEDLFRGERDVEFRRKLEEVGFVLDPEIEKEALAVMVSSATDHMESFHSPDTSEGYISEPSNAEASVLPETKEQPSEQTDTLHTEAEKERNTTTDTELVGYSKPLAGAQMGDIESPHEQSDTILADKEEKEPETTTDIEHTNCTAAPIDSHPKVITENERVMSNDEAQHRPSIHMDERCGGLKEPSQDTVILPPRIEKRDFAFVDKAIRRKPVGSGTSRPSSPADTSMNSTPLEGNENTGLYNLDNLPVMLNALDTEDDKRHFLQKRGISFQEPTSNPPSRTPSKSYQRPLVNAINDDVKKQDAKPTINTIKHPYPPTLHPSPQAQEKKKNISFTSDTNTTIINTRRIPMPTENTEVRNSGMLIEEIDDDLYTPGPSHLQETHRPILSHSISAPTHSLIWDDASALAPSLISTETKLSDSSEKSNHTISRKPIPKPPRPRPNISSSPVETTPPPSDSTLNYLRTHQDNQPQHIRKKQKGLTKEAITASNQQKADQKTTHILNQARAIEFQRAHNPLPPSSSPSFLSLHPILKSPSLYISLILFQIGLNSTLILLTIVITRIRSGQIVTLMGEELVFGVAISFGIMGIGVIWGLVLGMKYGVWSEGKQYLLGLREVSTPGDKRKFGRKGDLEAGFGVGEGDKKVNVVRLCVCPKHRDSPRDRKAMLDSRARGQDISNAASTSRSGPNRPETNTHTTATNTTYSSKPPIPSIFIQPSPIQTREPAELAQFILPPPPATRRSSMRSRPHSRVYTQNIQLDNLRPDGTRVGKRKEKTLSLQLRDMPEVESPRDRRTRSMQELEVDVFIIGDDEDD